MKEHCDSIIMIVLGGTGDLMSKKIAPALYSLHRQKKLPWNFKLVGFSRKEMSDRDYELYLHQKIESRLRIKDLNCDFCKHIHYQKGDFNDPKSFLELKERILTLEKESHEYCKIIFYLAVPQKGYAQITEDIEKMGFPKEKINIIYEKPFGLDTKSAIELDKKIKTCFSEEHIYRIDHYLGKIIIKNIAAFRQMNAWVNDIWKPVNITKIEISTLEDYGVEDRGVFYESVGAFKDVGENHLLAIIALLVASTDDLNKDVRKARADATSKLHSMSREEIIKNTYRAQYSGYKHIREVNPESSKETYFKIRTWLDDPAWAHIPIILEAGKGLRANDKKVTVHFSDNRLIFQMLPDEAISIELKVKTNGEITKEMFTFKVKDKEFQYVDEYATLFQDIFVDDQSNFVSIDEVLAQWRFSDPIITAWEQDLVPLNYYEKGTTPLVEL